MRCVWIGMALLLLCAVTWAQDLVQCPQPPPQSPSDSVTVWEVVDGTPDLSAPAEHARAWLGVVHDSECNADRCIDIGARASVAQWIVLSVDGTNVQWHVFKPGAFAAPAFRTAYNSNGDVGITFSGFGNLESLSEDDEISTFYALILGDLNQQPVAGDWFAASELNDAGFELFELQDHLGAEFLIWQQVQIAPCNSACDYESQGVICARANEQKPWVDRETGTFDPDYPDPTFPG